MNNDLWSNGSVLCLKIEMQDPKKMPSILHNIKSFCSILKGEFLKPVLLLES